MEQISISSLVLDPSNARKHSPKNLEAIKGSLAKFGQQKPIVISSDLVVIAGNGTLEAARALGWKTIGVERSKLKGTDAIAYAVADNRTGELAEWDGDVLGKTLASLKADNFDLDTIGFNKTDLDILISDGLPVDSSDEEWEGMPEFSQEDKTGYQKIVVHFKVKEDRDSFAHLIGQKITDNTRSLWFPFIEIEKCMDKRYSSR